MCCSIKLIYPNYYIQMDCVSNAFHTNIVYGISLLHYLLEQMSTCITYKSLYMHIKYNIML